MTNDPHPMSRKKSELYQHIKDGGSDPDPSLFQATLEKRVEEELKLRQAALLRQLEDQFKEQLKAQQAQIQIE